MEGRPGVEVFVFHWGCTGPGALGDDQRGPTFGARRGTEYVLPLHDNFLCNFRTDLFLAMRHFEPPGMKSPRHGGNETKYCTSFSNRLNALSPPHDGRVSSEAGQGAISI